jgi:putative component of membrane protein insertase Oxa1/YidC/SpoIIIJ protein YidD
MRNLLEHIRHLPRKLIAVLITGYQRTLSPDHGPLKTLHRYGYCRHEPTCSQYAKEQILARGIFFGSLKALRQVLTCHPWHPLSKEKILKITSIS